MALKWGCSLDLGQNYREDWECGKLGYEWSCSLDLGWSCSSDLGLGCSLVVGWGLRDSLEVDLDCCKLSLY